VRAPGDVNVEMRDLKATVAALRAHVKELEAKMEETRDKVRRAMDQVRQESFTFFAQADGPVAVYANHPQIDAAGDVTPATPQVGTIAPKAWVRMSHPLVRIPLHDEESNSTKISTWYRMVVLNPRDCNDIKVYWVPDVSDDGTKSFLRFESYAM
jgi:hypothetical protein